MVKANKHVSESYAGFFFITSVNDKMPASLSSLYLVKVRQEKYEHAPVKDKPASPLILFVVEVKT